MEISKLSSVETSVNNKKRHLKTNCLNVMLSWYLSVNIFACSPAVSTFYRLNCPKSMLSVSKRQPVERPARGSEDDEVCVDIKDYIWRLCIFWLFYFLISYLILIFLYYTWYFLSNIFDSYLSFYVEHLFLMYDSCCINKSLIWFQIKCLCIKSNTKYWTLYNNVTLWQDMRIFTFHTVSI